MDARVVSVARDARHAFSKVPTERIRLLEGVGVEGDAHCGTTVQHRSRVAVDPTQPNLRQVHLIASELFEEAAVRRFGLAPGDLGENVLTAGIDLLALPVGARLRLGATAVVELTGLRNPCGQIEAFREGLLAAVLERTAEGALVRKAGVMGVVAVGGLVGPGDSIAVEWPAPPHRRLERV